MPAPPPADTLLTMLVRRHLRFDAADPHWPDRDRLILSHAAAPPDSAGLTLRAPPGLAVAMAVGMAIGERALAGRFGRSLVDHRVWLVAEARDLAAGSAREAADVAGTLLLGRLTVLAALPHDNPRLRAAYQAAGWAVRCVADGDQTAGAAALGSAMRSQKPTLILAMAPPAASAMAPAAEMAPHPSEHAVAPSGGNVGDAAASTAGAVPARPANSSSNEAASLGSRTTAQAASDSIAGPAAHAAIAGAAIDGCGGDAGAMGVSKRGPGARRAWLKRLRRHASHEPFQHAMGGHFAPGWQKPIHAAETASAQPPAAALTGALAQLSAAMPELAGLPWLDPRAAPPQHGAFAGCGASWDGLDQAALAAALGMSLHGGLRPVVWLPGSTVETGLAVLRLAAQCGAPLLHIVSGSACLAAPPIDRLHVFRPADAAEALECLAMALRHTTGPSVLVLPEGTTPSVPHSQGSMGSAGSLGRHCARGAYLVLAPPDRQVTLLASGASLAAAQAVASALAAQGVAAAIASVPCRAVFEAQDDAYRRLVLGQALRAGIGEPAAAFAGLLGPDDLVFADTAALAHPAIAQRILRRLQAPAHGQDVA